MSQTTLKVSGLKEFSKALRQIDKESAKGLRVAMNGSADFLIGKVRPQIPSRTGNARASLKARSSRTEVRIAVGGRKAPYYPWLDFGGKTGIRKSVVRPFFSEGRYLYPTLRRNKDAFQQVLEKAIVGVAEGAGMDVN